MMKKKGIELRSNGQPGAAVPTFFLSFICTAAIFVVCGVGIGAAWAQSSAASQVANAAEAKTAAKQSRMSRY